MTTPYDVIVVGGGNAALCAALAAREAGAGAGEGAGGGAGRQHVLHRGRLPLRVQVVRGAGRAGRRPLRRGEGVDGRVALHRGRLLRRPHARHRGPRRPGPGDDARARVPAGGALDARPGRALDPDVRAPGVQGGRALPLLGRPGGGPRGGPPGAPAPPPAGVETLAARAVVLAAGGFEANPEMRTRYLGRNWELARVRGTPYNTGDGIRMALEIGAVPWGHWSGCHSVQWDLNAPWHGDRKVGDGFQKHRYPLGPLLHPRG